MNRKQKIIVSTTGIFLVLLILVGLTYAYFLTRINGNKNDKSISVSTANLELVYADVNDTLISATNVEPGVSFTKMFSATNNGNKKIDEYGVALENVINTLERTEDLVYTISCTQYLKQGYSITKDGNNYTVNGTTSGTCNGVSDEQEFPTMGKILVTNSIEDDKVQVYTLVVTYKDTGLDQSIDMNKQFSAKANLVNPSTFGVLGSGTLASAIIENGADVKRLLSPGQFNEKNVFVASTLEECLKYAIPQGVSNFCYKVGTETYDNKNSKNIKNIIDVSITAQGTSWDDDKQDFINDGLFKTPDDYGISYYFRGAIINNYINFAGMCWRIVRIAGDGSIKLILEDQDSTCETNDGNWNIPTETGGTIKEGNYGYTEYAANTLTSSDGTTNSKILYIPDYLKGKTNSDKSMATAFKNFQTGHLSNYLSYLKVGDWCLNDKAYASYNNNSTPLTNQEILDKQIKDENVFYDSYIRLNSNVDKNITALLNCNGTNMNKYADNTDMYVGTLTADELVYATGGGQVYYHNYLDTNMNDIASFSLLTPARENVIYNTMYLTLYWNYTNTTVEKTVAFRPSINLKSGIKITSGDGTKEKPYEIQS